MINLHCSFVTGISAPIYCIVMYFICGCIYCVINNTNNITINNNKNSELTCPSVQSSTPASDQSGELCILETERRTHCKHTLVGVLQK